MSATAVTPLVHPTGAQVPVIDSPAALGRLAGAIRRNYRKGSHAAVVLDAEWRLFAVCKFFELDLREQWLSVFDDVPEGGRVMLVTHRRGHGRVARLSDEHTWERWSQVADARGVTFLDWWVLTDPCTTFSVAQFSPRSARWPALERQP